MSELKEIGIRWEENGELHFSHVYLKSEADKVIAEKDQRIKELTPHWVRLSDELPTTYGPHLVIFQNGKGGCLSFNVETKSFQVEEPIQLWADAKYIFGDWTAEK